MKNLMPFILIIILLLVSCDIEPMNEYVNPFVGTWESDLIHLVFTDTHVTATRKSDGVITIENVLYTYDGIHLILHHEDRIFIYHYIFRNDGTLILEPSVGILRRI